MSTRPAFKSKKDISRYFSSIEDVVAHYEERFLAAQLSRNDIKKKLVNHEERIEFLEKWWNNKFAYLFVAIVLICGIILGIYFVSRELLSYL